MNGGTAPQAVQSLPCACTVSLQVLLEAGVQLRAAEVAELECEVVPRVAGPQKERLDGEAGSCVHLQQQYMLHERGEMTFMCGVVPDMIHLAGQGMPGIIQHAVVLLA